MSKSAKKYLEELDSDIARLHRFHAGRLPLPDMSIRKHKFDSIHAYLKLDADQKTGFYRHGTFIKPMSN